MKRLWYAWLVLGAFLAACTSDGVTPTMVEPDTPVSATTSVVPATTITTSVPPTTTLAPPPEWEVIPAPTLSHIVYADGAVIGLGEGSGTLAVWRTDDLAQWSPVRYETYAPCPGELVGFIMTAKVVDDRIYVFTSTQRPCDEAQGANDTPVAFISDDLGSSWERVSFPDREAYISDLEATGDTLYAVGWFYPDADSPPQPAIWNSADGGRTWDRVSGSRELFPADAMIASIKKLDDRLIAVGTHDFVINLWLSSDGGASWTRTEFPDSGGIESISTLNDTLVLFTNRWDADSATHTYLTGTTTDGVEFEWTDLGPAFGNGIGSVSVAQWQDSLVVLGGVYERSDPQYCFQDIDTCGQMSTVVNIGTPGSWRRLETAGNTDLPRGPIAVIDSHIIVLSSTYDSTTLWIWDLAAESTTVEVSAPTTTVPLLPIHDPAEPLEIGVTERFVFIDSPCGTHYLEIAGQNWIRTEFIESADLPLRTLAFGEQALYATITLVDETHIEARLETGELVAVYQPTTESAPACF